MFHIVAHSAGPDLFATWHEADALWTRLVARVAHPVAVCLMPDHVHVLHRRDVRPGLLVAMRAFARWRNHQRGETGVVWRAAPASERMPADSDKARRSERYVHLNPCRGLLVRDPLAWPFSTYLDAVGLAVAPVRVPAPDIPWLHRYTTSDPSVHVEGSALPYGGGGPARLDEVLDAVSHLTRTPRAELGRRRPARDLAIRVARVATRASGAEVARGLGVGRRTVVRVGGGVDDAVRRVERVLGDERFMGLPDGTLGFLRRRAGR